MDIRFDGRVVIVTGAAQGIGRAIAAAFMAAGAKVHAVDLDADGVASTARELGCTPHAIDLTKREAVGDLVAQIKDKDGRVDILALAAGGVCGQENLKLEDVTPDNWNAVFRANTETALWLSQAAAPMMTQAGWGRIVIISSNAGLRPSRTGLHAYTSAKHAVVGLTRQLSAELAGGGVTVNSIAPGLVMSAPAPRRQWESYGAEGQKRVLDGLHTRRLGEPEDIAAATLFFASDQAAWITGQVLSVDGGRS